MWTDCAASLAVQGTNESWHRHLEEKLLTPWECVGADPVQSYNSLGPGLNYMGKESCSQPSPSGDSQVWAFFLLSHFRGGGGNTEKAPARASGQNRVQPPSMAHLQEQGAENSQATAPSRRFQIQAMLWTSQWPSSGQVRGFETQTQCRVRLDPWS